MKKKIKNKLQHKKNGFLFKIIWLIILGLISFFLSWYVINGIKDMLAENREDKIVFAEIPENANLFKVANILKQNDIIKAKLFFIAYSTIRKFPKNISAGNYEFNQNMDYELILKKFKTSVAEKRDVITLTFKEGMNISEYSELLETNGICNKNDFLEACNSDKFKEKYLFLKKLIGVKNVYYLMEGFLFPDTYQFYKDSKSSEVMGKFLNNFEKKVLKNDKFKNLYTTNSDELKKALIIASIIQAEAANKEDMLKVSSVIHNRLKTLAVDGTNKYGEYSLNALRIDATVWYPYKNRKSVPGNIVNTFKSKYDTYSIIGLPAGAICNFGVDALYAALNPADTKYYYYCHSSTGEAFYATTHSAHIVNQKRAHLI